jgi:hypothetical protein
MYDITNERQRLICQDVLFVFNIIWEKGRIWIRIVRVVVKEPRVLLGFDLCLIVKTFLRHMIRLALWSSTSFLSNLECLNGFND